MSKPKRPRTKIKLREPNRRAGALEEGAKASLGSEAGTVKGKGKVQASVQSRGSDFLDGWILET